MKALVYERYGSPDVVELREVPAPVPGDDDVRVRVHATSLNASDIEFLTARPRYVRMFGLFRPAFSMLGSDVAGTVEAVGRNVTRFAPGDAVLGDLMFKGWGGLAEVVCAPESVWLEKPADVPFDVAASIPQAGVVALQGLRNKGRLRDGEHVLINGAGGGAGTFAIQIAKRMGAEVTAVDSGAKLERMRALGADHVVDYTGEDFTARGARYDLILDFVAHRSLFDHRGALAPAGRYVLVGGSVPRLLQTVVVGGLLTKLGRRELGMLMHEQNLEDIAHMIELSRAGEVVPQIDRRFPLRDGAEALRYLAEGRATGKVVVMVADAT